MDLSEPMLINARLLSGACPYLEDVLNQLADAEGQPNERARNERKLRILRGEDPFPGESVRFSNVAERLVYDTLTKLNFRHAMPNTFRTYTFPANHLVAVLEHGANTEPEREAASLLLDAVDCWLYVWGIEKRAQFVLPNLFDIVDVAAVFGKLRKECAIVVAGEMEHRKKAAVMLERKRHAIEDRPARERQEFETVTSQTAGDRQIIKAVGLDVRDYIGFYDMMVRHLNNTERVRLLRRYVTLGEMHGKPDSPGKPNKTKASRRTDLRC